MCRTMESALALPEEPEVQVSQASRLACAYFPLELFSEH